jgi:hypothetical protein
MAHKQPHAEFEFFGPHGPALLLLALPLTVLGLAYGCNERGCMQLLPTFWVPGFAPDQPIYTHEAMAAVTGWFALVLLLHLLLPGKHVKGVPLPDGSRLTYKLNGGLRRSASVLSAGRRPRQGSWRCSGHGSSCTAPPSLAISSVHLPMCRQQLGSSASYWSEASSPGCSWPSLNRFQGPAPAAPHVAVRTLPWCQQLPQPNAAAAQPPGPTRRTAPRPLPSPTPAAPQPSPSSSSPTAPPWPSAASAWGCWT